MLSRTILLQEVTVDFPFKPYPQQEEIMKAMVSSLQKNQNALIESPTGTGKTLCMLCAALAWRAAYVEWRKAIRNPDLNQNTELLKRLHRPAFGDLPFDTSRDNGKPLPKIYYASRTHSQLSQVVNEVKNTVYRPIVTVLGSRDQMCLKAEVSNASSGAKAAKCKSLVKKRGCEYFNGTENFGVTRELKTQILDLEDLVKFGEKLCACPYYLSQKVLSEAEIIFLPYNYLIDPKNRRAMNIDLNNSIIIFDEGHNIESSCSDVSSFEITNLDLEEAEKEVEYCLQKLKEGTNFDLFYELEASECALIAAQIKKFKEILVAESRKNPEIIKEGNFLYDIFNMVDINHENSDIIMKKIESIIHILCTGKSAEGRFKISSLLDALQVLYLSPIAFNRELLKNYRVYLKYQKTVIPASRGSLTSAPKTVDETVVNFWCFSSAIAMQNLVALHPRSIMFASGTLSPLKSFSEDFGISFPNRVENTHVIDSKQVMVNVLKRGPDGVSLSSSFNRRDDAGYMNDLGNCIRRICEMTPEGVLCFFTSYGMMEKAMKAWKVEGPSGSILRRIGMVKNVFEESKSKDEFNQQFKNYEKCLKNGKGGIFFAICRGKASEGIDFSDGKARAVIICGIPYPALKDPKIMLKKRILNDNSRSSKAGEEWYRLQAFRAVNQAIGRVIRHRNDYGSVFLCDERFAERNIQSQLPAWIRPLVKVYSQFKDAESSIDKFYIHNRGEVFAPKVIDDPLAVEFSKVLPKEKQKSTQKDPLIVPPVTKKQDIYKDPLAVNPSLVSNRVKSVKASNSKLTVVDPLVIHLAPAVEPMKLKEPQNIANQAVTNPPELEAHRPDPIVSNPDSTLQNCLIDKSGSTAMEVDKIEDFFDVQSLGKLDPPDNNLIIGTNDNDGELMSNVTNVEVSSSATFPLSKKVGNIKESGSLDLGIPSNDDMADVPLMKSVGMLKKRTPAEGEKNLDDVNLSASNNAPQPVTKRAKAGKESRAALFAKVMKQNLSREMHGKLKGYLNEYSKKNISKTQLVPLVVTILFEEFPGTDKLTLRDDLLRSFREIMGWKMYEFVDQTIKAKKITLQNHQVIIINTELSGQSR